MDDEVKKIFEMYEDKKASEVLSILSQALFYMLVGSKVPPERAQMLMEDFLKHFSKMLSEAPE
jgi:hypothetical protein